MGEMYVHKTQCAIAVCQTAREPGHDLTTRQLTKVIYKMKDFKISAKNEHFIEANAYKCAYI